MEVENKITDIYEGEIIHCWKDDECVYINFPWCCLNFPIDDIDSVLDELHEFIAIWVSKDYEKAVEPLNSGNWEEEIKDIVDKSGFNKNNDTENYKQYEEKAIKLFEHFDNDKSSLLPSEQNQEFLNPIFLGLALNERAIDALITVFKMGLTFQKYRDEFEDPEKEDDMLGGPR